MHGEYQACQTPYYLYQARKAFPQGFSGLWLHRKGVKVVKKYGEFGRERCGRPN